MANQAKELIAKFGGNYNYEQLRQIKKDFGLAKIQYEYPGSVKANNFTELEELARKGDADAKKAIKLLLQTKRLNEKPGQG
ncbi:MAG: hypothetical protein WBV73_12730 [Phormidium sp.]